MEVVKIKLGAMKLMIVMCYRRYIVKYAKEFISILVLVETINQPGMLYQIKK